MDSTSLTTSLYTLIASGDYGEAVRQLTQQLQAFPRSRAALSLLGHAHYALADYRSAAQCYEELCRFYPEVDAYRLYYAQCLGKAGLAPEATRAAARVASDAHAGRVLALQASVAYAEGDLAAARALLDRCPAGDRDARVNRACVSFKEGAVEEARRRFEEAVAASGWAPDLAYNIAACHFAAKQPAAAARIVEDLIRKGVTAHPELAVCQGGADAARSVGNTPALRETHLVEAFNLKAALALAERAPRAAREALADMPPRAEDELDPVTLHNSALAEADSNPTGAFRKLNFLLSHPPFPAEAFGNLLLLYLRHGCVDMAADALAENPHLSSRFLSPALFDFLDACLMAPSSAEEAYRRFDALSARHVEALRRHTKAIQDARLANDKDAMKASLGAYDETLEAYLPVLLATVKLYWDHDNYATVERLLRMSAEFASEADAWRLGLAHAVFMQGGTAGAGAGAGVEEAAKERYREAIRHYEPVVRRHMEEGAGGGEAGGGGLLDVTAIVLANLCVAYIMTGAQGQAEELMRAVERAEEAKLLAEAAAAAPGGGGGGAGGAGGGGGGGAAAAAASGPPGGAPSASPAHPPTFHLCIVNLVIGTLYCAKGNLEFGVTRVLRALEPPARKLGPDTWFYVKRVLLQLASQLAKNLVEVKDEVLADVLRALDAAELHGGALPAAVQPPAVNDDDAEPPRTIAAEARVLKVLFLKLREKC
jgi:tetratricopeptide repeat protein 30